MKREWLVFAVIALAIALAGCPQPGGPVTGKGEAASELTVTSKSPGFPAKFLWGVATSGYQFEGFDSASQDFTQWSVLANLPGATWVSKATDFIHRYKDDPLYDPVGDVTRASDLKCNAFRIGIEWARVQPEKRPFDDTYLNTYYDGLISYIKGKKINGKSMEPIVTLLHYTYPEWLESQGGWENPATIGYYLDYVRHVVTRYADSVTYWITFNEPNVWVPAGWLLGVNPPFKQSLSSAIKVTANVILAHRLAYDLIHSIYRSIGKDVAVSSNIFILQFQLLPATLQRSSFDADWIYPAIVDKVDYVSLDYYYTFHSLSEVLSSFGKPWLYPIDPAGFYAAIMTYARKYPWLPILIAENGMATRDGTSMNGYTRTQHLNDHLYYLKKAISAGAKVFGYLYWSITDNYEWGEYVSRAGLYSIDYSSMTRTKAGPDVWKGNPTYAADLYQGIISGQIRPTPP